MVPYYSREVAVDAILLVQDMKLKDYITVEVQDVFKVQANELRQLKLDYISTSAATNPIFDMKIIYLAVGACIPNVLMPESSLRSLKTLGLLRSRDRKIENCSLFSHAHVQPDSNASGKGDRRNIWCLDLSTEQAAIKIKGLQLPYFTFDSTVMIFINYGL